MTSLTQSAAVAWRAQRHWLGGGATDAAAVVERLVAVPSNSGDAELSVNLRMTEPTWSGIPRALDSGDLIRTYAWGGAIYLMTLAIAADHLALRSIGRQWELPSWRSHYGLESTDWPALLHAVREAVEGNPTQDELAKRVARHSGFAHLEAPLKSRSQTLLKPLAWQGAFSLGIARDGQLTLRSTRAWPEMPSADEAGPRAIAAYLGAYGPAPREQLHSWFTDRLSVPRKRLEGWLASMPGLATIDLEGAPAYVMGDDVDEIATAEPSSAVHLLPAYDQWVMGPGTDSAIIVPPAHRAVISRGASPIIVGGVVSGTWRLSKGALVDEWFTDSGRPPGWDAAVQWWERSLPPSNRSHAPSEIT